MEAAVKRRGLTLVEGMVASVLAFMTLYVFLTLFGTSYEHAAMTRNRAIALILARSMMDEFEAHPYGAPAPEEWDRREEEPVRLMVAGRPVEALFTKKIKCANDSFVNSNVKENWDVVTLTINWHEQAGDDQGKVRGRAEAVKELVVRYPVWR